MVTSMPQTCQAEVAIINRLCAARIGAAVKRQARTMTSKNRRLDTQQDTSLAEAARTAPNGGFKRLALPAVAAAVQTLPPAKPRKSTYQELAALLRRDGNSN